MATANGFSEFIIGRDMFGNEISDEQRQESLHHALALITPIGMSKAGKVLNLNSNTKNHLISTEETIVSIHLNHQKE